MKNLTTLKNFIKNNFYAFDIIAILIMVILTELSIADNDKIIKAKGKTVVKLGKE